MQGSEKPGNINEQAPTIRPEEIGKHVAEVKTNEEIDRELKKQWVETKRIRDAFNNIDYEVLKDQVRERLEADGERPEDIEHDLPREGSFWSPAKDLGNFREQRDFMGAMMLCMLAKVNTGEGEKNEIVELSYGDLSLSAFDKNKKGYYEDKRDINGKRTYYYQTVYKILKNMPFEVYCIQEHSYGKDLKDRVYNPEEYLKKNARFVVKNGDITMGDGEGWCKDGYYFHEDLAPAVPEEKAIEMMQGLANLYNQTVADLKKQDESKK